MKKLAKKVLATLLVFSLFCSFGYLIVNAQDSGEQAETTVAVESETNENTDSQSIFQKGFVAVYEWSDSLLTNLYNTPYLSFLAVIISAISAPFILLVSALTGWI